jgi:hypothetical protein
LTETRAAADPRIARAVFAVLVLACFAALLLTQRLKHTPTVVQKFMLTSQLAPYAGGEAAEERISFELKQADRVTVAIEGPSGEAVATLVKGLPLGSFKTLSLRWNGRRGTARGYGVLRRADGYTTLLPRTRGALAPAGEYTVRVSLQRQKRTVPSPRTFELVGAPAR